MTKKHRTEKPYDVFLLRMNVDEFGTELGVQNRLAGIKSPVTGEYIAHRTGNGIANKAFRAKELHTDDERGNGAVDHAAKKRRDAK